MAHGSRGLDGFSRITILDSFPSYTWERNLSFSLALPRISTSWKLRLRSRNLAFGGQASSG